MEFVRAHPASGCWVGAVRRAIGIDWRRILPSQDHAANKRVAGIFLQQCPEEGPEGNSQKIF